VYDDLLETKVNEMKEEKKMSIVYYYVKREREIGRETDSIQGTKKTVLSLCYLVEPIINMTTYIHY